MAKSIREKTIQAEFGEQIKAKRKQKHITQEELSELAGITDVYLRDLERGSYTATWVICLKICTALDIDIRDIQTKYIVPEITAAQKHLKNRANGETLC
ncbi:MAG: helix-turn-helix domain-containing protein [Oscillospiraceae bacterium]|nr:helix-turn-helix domain-containing protein [Oscillospiraceae bacterium]